MIWCGKPTPSWYAATKSKFDKLLETMRDAQFRDEKMLVFTEHRDTANYLSDRLEAIGFTGQVARLHGGMDYVERDRQVALFRAGPANGGAKYLIATDAAGEGVNLQFCWLMFNYDIPWNPARLEQRMGRIHRYGQKKDHVFIANLVAASTREGKVMGTLLKKLDEIRRALGSDKVFDVIGRLFENVPLKTYLERSVLGEDLGRHVGRPAHAGAGAGAAGTRARDVRRRWRREIASSPHAGRYGARALSAPDARLHAGPHRTCRTLTRPQGGPEWRRRFVPLRCR